jgi:V/A-type H+-transporting ATPase subunit D
VFKSSLIKLNQTYKEMGKLNFDTIKNLRKMRYKPQINVIYKKVAGIIIPKINYELLQEKQLPAYSFEHTSHHLDELIILLKNFFEKLITVSEMEDLILKLSINFQKLNRRINALDHQIIPNLKYEIKKVKDTIEEIEREEYVRLKITKNTIYIKKSN